VVVGFLCVVAAFFSQPLSFKNQKWKLHRWTLRCVQTPTVCFLTFYMIGTVSCQIGSGDVGRQKAYSARSACCFDP